MGRKLEEYKFTANLAAFIAVCTLLYSCGQPGTGRKNDKDLVVNTQETTTPGYGRILTSNPNVLTGNRSLAFNYNLNYLLSDQVRIPIAPGETTLVKKCASLDITDDDNIDRNTNDICMYTRGDASSGIFSNSSLRWGYPAETTEFLQVHSFKHVSDHIDQFHGDLLQLKTYKYNTPSLGVDAFTSIPETLFETIPSSSIQNNSHWKNEALAISADCTDAVDNAYYRGSAFEICMGRDKFHPETFKFAQDPSLIYHEMGHAFVDILLNTRNSSSYYEEKGLIDVDIYQNYDANKKEICQFSSTCGVSWTSDCQDLGNASTPVTTFNAAGAVYETALGCYYNPNSNNPAGWVQISSTNNCFVSTTCGASKNQLCRDMTASGVPGETLHKIGSVYQTQSGCYYSTGEDDASWVNFDASPENAKCFVTNTCGAGLNAACEDIALTSAPTESFFSNGSVYRTAEGCFYGVDNGSVKKWIPFESSFDRAAMGYRGYDEAGSINEGLSDYFSYYKNQRTHMGEWALGTFLAGSRPMREDDSLHISGVDTSSSGRLSYPKYLNYDPNDPDLGFEDIHYSGQIISHFLVAMTEGMQDACYVSNAQAIDYVFYALSETLAYLGDLTSVGNKYAEDNGGYYTVNAKPSISLKWLRGVNPITFRKFAQHFAKNILTISSRHCASLFTQDHVENILDNYGLLLFKTYNYNGYGSTGHYNPIEVETTITNRKFSELISKDLIELESRTTEYSEYFIFDARTSIKKTMDGYKTNGLIGSLSPLTDSSDFGYNNGNGRASPGEVVGLFVNLFNDSNSTMGGVRISGADWAHMEDYNPCSNLSDGFPSTSFGGQACSALTSVNYTEEDRMQPVCMLEYNDGSATKLLSQKNYFEEMKANAGLREKDCLDRDNPATCMVRVIEGTETAQFSKLDPKSNWLESVSDVSGQNVDAYNLIFLEINKNIPIGTFVTCRLRASFTNCDDCHHDANNSNYDYKDWQYAGEDPFKIITIRFQVTD